MSRTRAITMQAIGGYANTGISIIHGLILIPLSIHYIGAHTYGVWLATGGVLAWLGFIDMGIASMMVQRIANEHGKEDFQKAALYFTNGMVFYLFISAIFLLLGYSASLWILPLIYSGEESSLLKSCFQVAVLATGINILNECLRAFAQAVLRPMFAIMSLIIGRLFGLGLTIGLLFYGFGLWSIPLGMLLTSGIVLILNIININKIHSILGTKNVFSKEIIKEYIEFSPALVVGRLGKALTQGIEPLLITAILSKPEVATAYVVMKRAADIVGNMLSVLIASIAPSFSNLVGENNLREIAQSVKIISLLLFAAGMVGFGTYAILNESFIRLWVGSEFLLGSQITLILAMGGYIMFLANSAHRLLIGVGDIKKPSYWLLIEAVLRVFIMYILLIMIGIEGIPLAMIVTSTILYIVLWLRFKALLPIMFNYKWFKHGLVFFGVFLVAFFVKIYLPVTLTWSYFLIIGIMVPIVIAAFMSFLYPILPQTILERLSFMTKER